MASSGSTLLDAVTGPLMTPLERLRRRFSRYDCALAAIPVSYLGAAAASAIAAVPTDAAVVTASPVGAPVITNVLFVTRRCGVAVHIDATGPFVPSSPSSRLHS